MFSFSQTSNNSSVLADSRGREITRARVINNIRNSAVVSCYQFLLRTGSMDNAFQELSLA